MPPTPMMDDELNFMDSVRGFLEPEDVPDDGTLPPLPSTDTPKSALGASPMADLTPDEADFMRSIEPYKQNLAAQVLEGEENRQVYEALSGKFGNTFLDLPDEQLADVLNRTRSGLGLPIRPAEQVESFRKRGITETNPLGLANFLGVGTLAKGLRTQDLQEEAQQPGMGLGKLEAIKKLQAMGEEERRPLTTAAQIAQDSMDIVPFMTEMAVGAAPAKAFTWGAGKMLSPSLAKFAARIGAAAEGEGFKSLMAKGATYTAGMPGRMALAGATSVPSQAFLDSLPDGIRLDKNEAGELEVLFENPETGFGSEYFKNFLSQGTEIWSEGMGATLMGFLPTRTVKRLIPQYIKNATTEQMDKLGAGYLSFLAGRTGEKGRFANAVRGMFRSAQLGSFPEEWAEEDFGHYLQYMLTQMGADLGVDEPTIYGDPEQLAVRAGVLAVPQAGRAALGAAGGALDRRMTPQQEAAQAFQKKLEEHLQKQQAQPPQPEVVREGGDSFDALSAQDLVGVQPTVEEAQAVAGELGWRVYMQAAQGDEQAALQMFLEDEKQDALKRLPGDIQRQANPEAAAAEKQLSGLNYVLGAAISQWQRAAEAQGPDSPRAQDLWRQIEVWREQQAAFEAQMAPLQVPGSTEDPAVALQRMANPEAPVSGLGQQAQPLAPGEVPGMTSFVQGLQGQQGPQRSALAQTLMDNGERERVAKTAIDILESTGYDLLEALAAYRDYGTVGAATEDLLTPEQTAEVDQALARYLELTPSAQGVVSPELQQQPAPAQEEAPAEEPSPLSPDQLADLIAMAEEAPAEDPPSALGAKQETARKRNEEKISAIGETMKAMDEGTAQVPEDKTGLFKGEAKTNDPIDFRLSDGLRNSTEDRDDRRLAVEIEDNLDRIAAQIREGAGDTVWDDLDRLIKQTGTLPVKTIRDGLRERARALQAVSVNNFVGEKNPAAPAPPAQEAQSEPVDKPSRSGEETTPQRDETESGKPRTQKQILDQWSKKRRDMGYEGASREAVQGRKRVARIVKALSDWKTMQQLQEAYGGQSDRSSTNALRRELKELEELGYVQKAWLPTGEPVYAAEGVPMREGLLTEEELDARNAEEKETKKKAAPAKPEAPAEAPAEETVKETTQEPATENTAKQSTKIPPFDDLPKDVRSPILLVNQGLATVNQLRDSGSPMAQKAEDDLDAAKKAIPELRAMAEGKGWDWAELVQRVLAGYEVLFNPANFEDSIDPTGNSIPGPTSTPAAPEAGAGVSEAQKKELQDILDATRAIQDGRMTDEQLIEEAKKIPEDRVPENLIQKVAASDEKGARWPIVQNNMRQRIEHMKRRISKLEDRDSKPSHSDTVEYYEAHKLLALLERIYDRGKEAFGPKKNAETPAETTTAALPADRDAFQAMIRERMEARAKQPKEPATPPPPAPKAEPTPKPTAGEAAKGAYDNLTQGLKDVVDGLDELFGGGRLGIVPQGFDETSWREARAKLDSAYDKFQAAGRSIMDFIDAILDKFGTRAEEILMTWYDQRGTIEKEDADNADLQAVGENRERQGQRRDDAGKGPRAAAEDAPVLGGVPAQDVQEAPGPGRGEGVRSRPAQPSGAAGPENVAQDAADRQPGAGGAGLVPDGARGGRRGTRGGAGTDADAATAARVDGGSQERLGNYHIEDPAALVGGGQKTRFRKNQKAIETYLAVLEENRQPTAEERDAIAAYTGWGSFGQELFQGNWQNAMPKNGWESEDQWLRDHLGKEQWESAQRSIINAHYTDPPTVIAIWGLLRKMGFRGGRMLEPSVGIGNFIGLMPKDLKSKSDITGIELDELTGGMAKMLYPDANIRIMGYQESKTPDDFYDLVVGNWPFSATVPADRRYNKLAPALHDYFFLKALDQTRPGGLVVGITSSGTLDKVNTKVRLEMAKKAELVASFRLPTGAFGEYAGTAVVTDLIIFRKRAADNPMVQIPSWVNALEMTTPAGPKIRVNQYYHEHPENVLGTLDHGHHTTQGRPGMIVHRGDDFEERLTSLADQVKKGEYRPRALAEARRYVASNVEDRYNSVIEHEDGELYIVQGEQMVPMADVVRRLVIKNKKETAKRAAQVKALVRMRKTLGRLLDAQREAAPNEEAIRKELRDLYEAFAKEHGFINGSIGLVLLRAANDPASASLSALEHNLEQDPEAPERYEPATILFESTVRGRPKPENLGIQDAYVFARNESVEFDLDRVAELAKAKPEEVAKKLMDLGAIFKTPQGAYEHADLYLSGNVRVKLRDAIAAKAEGVEGMDRNIQALEEVLPETIPYYNIEAKFGNNWVPTEVYKEFIGMMLDLTEEQRNDLELNFGTQGFKFRMPNAFRNKAEATTQWGVPQENFDKLVQAALNNTTVTIRYRDDDGHLVVDTTATAAANEKIAVMRERFSEWVWSDPNRRMELEKNYNEVFNSVALPKFNGDFLSFEGMALQRGSNVFDLRQHQADAIARGVIQGRGLYAHEVGTGKTYVMGGIAVESRRFGKARKPLIFAHNANSATVAREIQEMYPSAKVLYIEAVKKGDRDVLMAQIANDDWDAIVVPHSQVDRFALRPETYEALAAQEIADLEAAAIEAAEEDNVNLTPELMNDEEEMKKVRSPRAKELVHARDRIIERVRAMSQKAAEDAIRIEDAGIDMIMVDEVHEFKKPPIATKMRMKGLNTSPSDRSVNLMFLLNHIGAVSGGRGVHLFTGTPITNTLNEIYNMMRFVMRDVMERDGVDHWDAWFGVFADQSTDVEVTAAGDYEPVTRLASFVNVPELRRMVGQYMDTVFAEDMPEFVPRKTASGKTMADNLTNEERDELENGRTENPVGRPYKVIKTQVSEMTAHQRAIREDLIERSREFRAGTPRQRRDWQKSGDPRMPIRVETDAANAGLDARLFNMGLSAEEESKIGRALDTIMAHYNEHPLATQAVFMERGFSDWSEKNVKVLDQLGEVVDTVKERYPRFNLAKEIVNQLVDRGIPREQIAIVDGSVSKEKRMQIADAMNRGQIRVVIGSTQTLGTGVNMQQNLRAMHHLDAPWKPGDLEQRNGRGHRQGNNWNSVLEYRYVTEGIDGRRWQVLVTKARFIKQFLHSTGMERVIEGDAADTDDSGGNDLLETLSEATGDPRILQVEKFKKDIDKLQRRERLHTEGIAAAKQRVGTLKRENQYNQDRLKSLEEDAATYKAGREAAGGFEMVIQGNTFNKMADANAALETAIRNTREGGLIGQYLGFDLFKSKFTNSPIEIRGAQKYQVGDSVQSIRGTLQKLPDHVNSLKTKVEENLRSIASLEKAQTEPFSQAQKLDARKQQLERLMQDLERNPVPAPSWLRQPTPIGTDVMVDGAQRVVAGHLWSKTGWYVLVEQGESEVQAVPYTEVRDEQGVPLYEERPFERPPIEERRNREEGDAPPTHDSFEYDEQGNLLQSTATTPGTGHTVAGVTQALEQSEEGPKVRAMMRAGKLRIVQSASEVPGGARRSADGAYDPKTDTMYLIADNMRQGREVRTLWHEAFHRAVELGELDGLLRELADMEMAAQRTGDQDLADWFREAKRRARVDRGQKHYPQELGAYALSDYEGAPAGIQGWVTKVLAKVKAVLLRTLGTRVGKLDRAMLLEVARAGLNPRLKPGPNGGPQWPGRRWSRSDWAAKDKEYMAAVEAGDMETAQRLVDEAARAAGYGIKAWHAGTVGNRFSREYIGRNSEEKWGFFFSKSRGVAEGYLGFDGIDTGTLQADLLALPEKHREAVYNLFNASEYDYDTWEDFVDEAIGLAEDEPSDYFSDAVTIASIQGKPRDAYLKRSGNLRQYYLRMDKPLAFKGTEAQPEVTADVDGLVISDALDIGPNNISGTWDTVYGVRDPAQVKSADPVTYDDAGNVIPLSERFQQDNPDIRYSTAEPADELPTASARFQETVRQTKEAFEGHFDEAMEWLGEVKKSVKAKKPVGDIQTLLDTLEQTPINEKPELKVWEPLLKSIHHYAKKVPGLKVVYDAARNFGMDRHQLQHFLYHASDDPEAVSELGAIQEFAKKNPSAWSKLEDYLWQRDRDAVGYRVKQEDDQWVILNPENAEVGRDTDEDAAWERAYQMEAADARAAGLTDTQSKMLLNVRHINYRMYALLMREARELYARLEEQGLPMPQVTAQDGTEVDLFEALRQMGDRRGHWMPRKHGMGRHIVIATRQKGDPRQLLKVFDTAAQAKLWATARRKEGYETTYKLSDTPSEQVYGDLDLVAMNDAINNVLQRMERQSKADLTDIGFQGKWVADDHYVMKAPNSKAWDTILSGLGGRFDEAAGEWHFEGVEDQNAFGKNMLERFYYGVYGPTLALETFSQAFATQVAGMVHEHGSRAHKIARSEATGEDVWQGYEKDAIKAIVLAGNSIAGGSAKRAMAQTMMAGIMGTTETWQEFKARNEGMDEEDAWKAYKEQVNERKIDSALQPVAYREATALMREMVRNEEPIERIIGVARGLAALKYLSGISSSLINMLALATNVPAVMLDRGGIPLSKTPALLKQALEDYGRYYMHMKHPDKLDVAPPTGERLWLMSEIARRGWDEAPYNHEAVAALQNVTGGMVQKLTDWSLLAFSVTERFNRAATIAAAYQGLVDQEKSPLTESRKEELLMQAKDISDDAHGVYGKPNMHSLGRGSSAFAQLFKSFYMFKTFSHNYVQVLAGMGSKEAKVLWAAMQTKDPKRIAEALKGPEARAFGWMLFSPAILAGPKATLATPVLLAAIGASGLLGADPPDDPEEAFYDWLGEMGPFWEHFGRSGLVGLAGINVKGSLAIGINEVPMNLEELMGAPLSVWQDLYQGGAAVVRGDILKGVEKLSPRIVSGIPRGIREATEGVTSKSNQPVYWGNERLRAGWYATMLRMIGFNPTSVSEKREEQWAEQEVERTFSDRRSEIYARVRAFAGKPQSRRNKSEWGDILMDILDYNAGVTRNMGYAGGLTPISRQSVKGVISKLDTPLRRERIRAGEDVDSNKPLAPGTRWEDLM